MSNGVTLNSIAFLALFCMALPRAVSYRSVLDDFALQRVVRTSRTSRVTPRGVAARASSSPRAAEVPQGMGPGSQVQVTY